MSQPQFTALLLAITFAVLAATSADAERDNMKIRIGMNGNEITATLIDNATSRDFVSLLPLELKLENYGSRKDKLFAEETIYGGSASGQRHFGWGCYYAPWGNLALFRSDFRYSSGLIKLEESTLV